MRFSLLVALCAPLLTAAWPSLLGPTHPSCPSDVLELTSRDTPISAFVKHCTYIWQRSIGCCWRSKLNPVSADSVNTGVLLQTRFKDLFPNETITVTQDRVFDLFRYASGQPDKIIIRDIPNVESIKRIVYFPSMRRRDGDGVLAESLTFAGYDVAFGDEELKVYVATVSSCL